MIETLDRYRKGWISSALVNGVLAIAGFSSGGTASLVLGGSAVFCTLASCGLAFHYNRQWKIEKRKLRTELINLCGYQDLNLGPRHYQCRALTN